jgi:ubiquinone/menaquinone biosynthesis C-methylase UbiE
MINTFKKKSLNRILQEIYAKKQIASGFVVEFGAESGSTKNFTNFVNIIDKKNIVYADKIIKEDKEIISEDLEKELSFKDQSFDSVIIFNVLEHVYNIHNAIKEIHRSLKKGGLIIGSTPFTHRIHNAPSDYNRYTEQFLNKIFHEKKFTNVSVEVYGYGPFTAAYVMIFDYTKLIPLLNNFILTFCILSDTFINIFTKTKLKAIYPITICFSAKK